MDVYNGKPYENGWFGGTIILGNTHIDLQVEVFVNSHWFPCVRGMVSNVSTQQVGAILLMATRNPVKSPVEVGSFSHYLQLAGA